MSEEVQRSDFDIVNAPRTEAERMRAAKILQANPDAFSGNIFSDKASQERECESKNIEKYLVQAFLMEQVHQADRLYEFGGVKASGEAWAVAYDHTLRDFDAIAQEHNYSEHQRERGREIVEELKVIGDKKIKNKASESDLKNEELLQEEGQQIIPEAMQHLRDIAVEYDNGKELAATLQQEKEITQLELGDSTPSLSTTGGLNFG